MTLLLCGCTSNKEPEIEKPDNSALKQALENSDEITNFTTAYVKDDYYDDMTIEYVDGYIKGYKYMWIDQLVESYLQYLPEGTYYYSHDYAQDKWYKDFTSAQSLIDFGIGYNYEDEIISIKSFINDCVSAKESLYDELLKRADDFKYVSGYYILDNMTLHYNLGNYSEEEIAEIKEWWPNVDKIDNCEYPVRNIAITIEDGYIHDLRFEYLDAELLLDGNTEDQYYTPVVLCFYDVGRTDIVLPEAVETTN